ncbi:hypothetical protein ACP4OV_004356 [Aristida adscensionis]
MKGMAGGGDDGMGPRAPAPPRGDHDHGGAGRAAAAPMPSQMAFFWGERAVVLFPGWPGARGVGAYVLCLIFVLALATLTEALTAMSRCIARRSGGAGRDGGGGASGRSAALLTAAHAARMGMAYLVMLAVMSFNVGVLLAAIAGHALGFFLARSRVHPSAARGGGGSGGGTPARDRGELGGLAAHPDDSKP